MKRGTGCVSTKEKYPFPVVPLQYGRCDSHLFDLDNQKAVCQGEEYFACAERPLAGGEEAPQSSSPCWIC